jgi:hypothetical protein
VDNKIYRTALVIGNADYLKGPLNAPVLDAQALAKVLRKLGFQVTEKINLDRKEMKNAIRAFGQELKQRPGVGLFYYSGHGIQDKDTNYLIPIGAPQSLQEAFDLPYETVLVNYVLKAMTQFNNPTNLVFLDSCRTPPNFIKSWAKGNAISPGMAKQTEVPGSLIAYAAAPGKPALDGKNGQNSPYVKHLLQWIQKPNLSLADALTEVRKAVIKATNKQQQPQYTNALNDKFYFNLGVEPLPSLVSPCLDCPRPQIYDTPPVPDDLATQLKNLHNPYAPLTVELWFDERGKTYFSSRHKTTIHYKINGLKKGTPAYLTLLNISPAGKLSMLFSESVAVGKVYGSLKTGQYATSVKQTYLEKGQEYFKAIVTSEPIKESWEAFIAAAVQGDPRMTFWGTEELTVMVD